MSKFIYLGPMDHFPTAPAGTPASGNQSRRPGEQARKKPCKGRIPRRFLRQQREANLANLYPYKKLLAKALYGWQRERWR